MPDKKEHEKKCQEVLGFSFSEVDEFLDQSFVDGGDDGHRLTLHHIEGVEEIRRVFTEKYDGARGNQAAQAAEVHIKLDFGIDHVPTRNEVINKLLAFTQSA